MSDFTRPGQLYYYDGLPAWSVRVAQPSRFKDVRLTLEFSAFPLPTGGLLACILSLFDIPDQPFYVHRIFNLDDDTVAKYLRSTVKAPYWVVEVSGGGEDRDVFRVLSLKETDFTAAHKKIAAYNKKLGKNLDGEAALRGFLKTFEPAAKEEGWEAGWAAVRKKFKLKA